MSAPIDRLSERHQHILRTALDRGTLRVSDLARQFGVHEMTIRRDLDNLAEQGLLTRTHGGARISAPTSAEVAYGVRLQENHEAKERIAEAALELVRDGDTVALDPSTTSLALARRLAERDVRAISTNLESANTLAAAGVPFLLIGGEFHPKSRSFIGPEAIERIGHFHPDWIFFSAKGFTADSGFTDAYHPEAQVKEVLIRSARRAVALLDASKVGVTALYTFATLAGVAALVTERPPAAELRRALDSGDTDLVVAADPAKTSPRHSGSTSNERGSP